MRCEPPDLQFYGEMRDLNLEFLELVIGALQALNGPVFGLDGAIADQLSRMRSAQLESIAATPCLLAGFAARRPLRALTLAAEPRPGADPSFHSRLRLFAAALWAYVWQMVRGDALRAALCAGGPRAALVGALSFREMRVSGEQAVQFLEARFVQGRFWPDLVRAARDGNAERLRLVQLSAIQLATSEARELRRRTAAAPTLLAGTR